MTLAVQALAWDRHNNVHYKLTLVVIGTDSIGSCKSENRNWIVTFRRNLIMQNLLSENAWIHECASYPYEIFNGSCFLKLLYEF
jgi:hypothetical protein